MDENLYNLVVESYKIATEENGYDLDSMSSEEVAIDMVSYDADLEDAEIDEVKACVERYRSIK